MPKSLRSAHFCRYLIALAVCVASYTYWRVLKQQGSSLRAMSVSTAQLPRLLNTSLFELRKALDSGAITSYDLVKIYLKRIDEVNTEINAISQVNKDALAIARVLDKERSSGQLRGELHGIPFLIKNIFITKDELCTTAGFSGLIDTESLVESTAVTKLRTAGAVLLGVASGSQWSYSRAAGKAPNGWSATGGHIRGIFHTNQDPLGSTTGPCLAVALGLSPFALGAETSGSIAAPARVAGVVGIKPTSGLVSRHGVFMWDERQDSVGVIAKSVEDAAIVLTIIAGSDAADPYSIHHPLDEDKYQRPKNLWEEAQNVSIEGLRIGIPRHCMKRDSFVMEKFEESLSVLRSLGAQIVDPVQFKEWNLQYSKDNPDEWRLAQRVSLARNMAKFLQMFAPNAHNLETLADVMKYTTETPEECFAAYGMRDFEAALQAFEEYKAEPENYERSLARRARIGKEISELLDREDCDLLVAPSWTETTANVGGCPQVSVPIGKYPADFRTKANTDGRLIEGPGIPIGILFVGRRYDDARVIAVADAFSRAAQFDTNFTPLISANSDLLDLNAKRSAGNTEEAQYVSADEDSRSRI
ncbi:hypothetical protein V495_06713 [Pseudogymnoascus sp. VKM F-4514 (FW-929)]|nr:hypothetical protein V495_06713 [Pseudogymnoascus sp. VKM F-4514 (FW-929)]KFY62225.1 hypothetical protein V497_02498 [Pseudogymnoascus sp. VKM F-4516 (FW-969)]